MNNEEKILAILGEMQSDINSLRGKMEEGFNNTEKRFNGIVKDVTVIMERIAEDAEKRYKLYIENVVTKEIATLFDGYTILNEKDMMLALEDARLRRLIEGLQIRVGVIEHKLSS